MTETKKIQPNRKRCKGCDNLISKDMISKQGDIEIWHCYKCLGSTVVKNNKKKYYGEKRNRKK